MSAVEVQQQAPAQAVAPMVLSPDAGELETFVFDLGMAYQAAQRLVSTSFVPATYQGRPQEAAAAIMTGQEVGLSPLASLRSIDIIQGTPAMRAITLRALVQSSGHEIWTDTSNATQAIVKGRRRGSDKVETSVWTIDRAKQMNLLGKSNWKTQPTAMLLARATSELVRLIAADVILGLPYSVEEVADLGEVEAAPVTAEAKAPARSRRVKRAPLPAEQEPELPEADAAGVVVEQELAPEPEPEAIAQDPLPEPVEDWATAEVPFDEPPVDWQPPVGDS